MREYRGVHLESPPGWDEIVKPLIDFVLDHGGTVDQVKEKFGGLRFYYVGPEDYDPELWDEFSQVVRAAEDKSVVTCEVTGKPGKLRSNGRWLRTLSDEQAELMGYPHEGN